MSKLYALVEKNQVNLQLDYSMDRSVIVLYRFYVNVSNNDKNISDSSKKIGTFKNC